MQKNPKCPKCANLKTQKRGKRRGKTRYQCRECKHWFQINRSREKTPSKQLLVQHLSGISFRNLSELHGCGVATAYRKVKKGLEELPTCIDVTRWYCQKFQGVLLVAAKYVFPNVVIQLCHVHFLRNAKYSLDLDANEYHQIFYPALSKLLIEKRSKVDFEKKAANLVKLFSKDETCSFILIDLARKQSLLQGYLHHKGTPTTTNLIESMNSHLESRVRPLKGFESFKHADLWLNAYFLRRRMKKYTDCSGKFRRLNGKTSLEITKKPGIDIPIFF